VAGDRARVTVAPDADALAAAVAARLLLALGDAQAERGEAAVVLTGGGIGIAVLREVAGASWRASVDWSRVDVWWGDERFLPDGDAERNDTQAREALLDALPLDPARVHPVPGPDGPCGDDVDAAARAYAEELAAAATDGAVPVFDVLLLGAGGEGHTASIFPHTSEVTASGTVTGVRDCPKPPPTRVSLTFDAIAAARSTWVVVAGEDKAGAVGAALGGADPADVPLAGVRARETLRFLLDRDAAAQLGARG
jgi:6-phosphogluconolactonase